MNQSIFLRQFIACIESCMLGNTVPGPLEEPLKLLYWLKSFKTFKLAEKPLKTIIWVRKPFSFILFNEL